MPQFDSIGSTRWINIRRSLRVVLCLPVSVQADATDREPPVEITRTLVVNAHGALIALTMKVQLNQSLVLENLSTGIQQRCRVVHMKEGHSGPNEIGVEFEEPLPTFWKIAFPPAERKPQPV
jgi:hypothetical protein